MSTEQLLVSPWGKCSTPISPEMSVQEMLVEADLNWKVEREPLGYFKDEEFVPTGGVALIRSTDKAVLEPYVTEMWNHIENEQAIEFMDQFVRKIGNNIDYLGSVKKGKLIFGLSELRGEKFDLFKGEDTISSYFLLSNPHAYGQAFDIRFTAVRDRCFNTLTRGLTRKGDLEIRLHHRAAFDGEIAERAVFAAKANLAQYSEMANLLASKKYEDGDVDLYYRAVFPTNATKGGKDKLSKPARLAQANIDTQPGAKYGRGTWWQIYNSATYVIDHLVGWAPETRLYAAWYGHNRKRKNQALHLACEFAKAA